MFEQRNSLEGRHYLWSAQGAARPNFWWPSRGWINLKFRLVKLKQSSDAVADMADSNCKTGNFSIANKAIKLKMVKAASLLPIPAVNWTSNTVHVFQAI